MNKQEFLTAISEIGTCEDDAQRRDLLAELSKNSEELFDTSEKLTVTNQELQTKNKELQEYNMKLWLQVGANKTDEQRRKDTTGAHVEEPEQKLSYNDLFDENGGLK